MCDTISKLGECLDLVEANVAQINAQLAKPGNRDKGTVMLKLDPELWDALDEVEKQTIEQLCVRSGWPDFKVAERVDFVSIAGQTVEQERCELVLSTER